MEKRTWNFVEKCFNEDDLQSYLVQNNVSIKRTAETKTGKTITYRCSKYRKYPACDFQIKIILNDNGETTVLTSNMHDHDHRSSTTRAASPVREIVKNAAAAGLTPGQTRRAVQQQYKAHVPDLQLYSLLKYHRSTIMPDIHSVDDFRSWCNEHSTMTSDPTSLHEPFVPKFYIHSCDDLFVFITTRKLISTAPLSSLLQVDATFKLNWNELPVLVCGSSDGNRRFHPFGVAVIGSDEAASSYITLFQTIKECVLNLTGIQYEVQYLMADGAKGITAAKDFEFPNCRRLMCWATCIYEAVDQKIRLQSKTFICPRCTDSEERRNRLGQSLVQGPNEDKREGPNIIQSPKVKQETLCNQQSKPTVVSDEERPGSSWPVGTESWYVHEIKPQRTLCVAQEKQRLSHQVCTLADLPQHISDTEDEATSDLFWPLGNESWFIHEIKPQRKPLALKSCAEKLMVPQSTTNKPYRLEDVPGSGTNGGCGYIERQADKLDDQSKFGMIQRSKQLDATKRMAYASDESSKHLKGTTAIDNQNSKCKQKLKTENNQREPYYEMVTTPKTIDSGCEIT